MLRLKGKAAIDDVKGAVRGPSSYRLVRGVGEGVLGNVESPNKSASVESSQMGKGLNLGALRVGNEREN